MQILVISSGNIVQLAKYPRYFAKQGHQVVFINPSWQNKLSNRTFQDEFGGLGVQFYSWAEFDKIWRQFRFSHIFGTQHGAALQVLKYQELMRIPALLQILDIGTSAVPDVFARQAPLIETYSKIKYLTGINPAIPEQVKQIIGRTDCYCVFYPIDTELLDSVSEKPTEEFVLIVSRHTDFKRVDLAIRACAFAKKRLVLITQDDKKKTLHKLATELGVEARFIELPQDKVKADLIKRCKVNIFTQMWAEAPCIPSAEALYCKKPSVIFDYPAQRAIEGGFSRYVEPGNWQAMGQKIINIWNNYNEEVKFATQGHAWVKNNLAPDVVSAQIEHILQGMKYA